AQHASAVAPPRTDRASAAHARRAVNAGTTEPFDRITTRQSGVGVWMGTHRLQLVSDQQCDRVIRNADRLRNGFHPCGGRKGGGGSGGFSALPGICSISEGVFSAFSLAAGYFRPVLQFQGPSLST